MTEIIVFIASTGVAATLALVNSFVFTPNNLSEFELKRRGDRGEASAKQELDRRKLLPRFKALQQLAEIILAAFLVGLLLVGFVPWAAVGIFLVFLVVTEVAKVRGWLAKFARGQQHKVEKLVLPVVQKTAPVLNIIAPASGAASEYKPASRVELRQLIDTDKTVLSAQDKTRLLGAFDFADKIISETMVPAQNITTVDITETVGPLLLDRLHKAGHNIFPVVDKNLDHVKGLLYMGDLVPLDPDLKDLADAVRPTVYFLPAAAKLHDVIAASLKTGRQFFLVSQDGKVVGLITLGDALQALLGEAPNKEVVVATSLDL